jgi:hypothetical protein
MTGSLQVAGVDRGRGAERCDDRGPVVHGERDREACDSRSSASVCSLLGRLDVS